MRSVSRWSSPECEPTPVALATPHGNSLTTGKLRTAGTAFAPAALPAQDPGDPAAGSSHRLAPYRTGFTGAGSAPGTPSGGCDRGAG
ncbi:hypothetical protein Sme01_27320 [Sphaerisporangium melleum]|nr:hypothetical protein Sme01_27320 [Sphaerisporangium melleum]